MKGNFFFTLEIKSEKALWDVEEEYFYEADDISLGDCDTNADFQKGLHKPIKRPISLPPPTMSVQKLLINAPAGMTLEVREGMNQTHYRVGEDGNLVKLDHA